MHSHLKSTTPIFSPTSSLSAAPSNLLQRKCACGGTPGPTGECEACRKKREAAQLQRAASHAAVVPEAPPIVHDVLRSPGQPLDAATRSFMEPRFGHDFSGVRVHTSAKAAESAQAVNALAYTVGQNVVFGAGQYALGTLPGQRLLAHELAHTIQQHPIDSTISPQRISIDRADSLLEREADAAADSALQGDNALVTPGRASTTDGLRAQRETPEGKSGKTSKATRKKFGDPKVPSDVVLMMDPNLRTEVNTIAPGAIVLNVTSVEDMVQQLGQVQAPFKTLFIMSHSLSSGDLGFGQGGTITFVQPEKVAQALQGAIPSDRAPSLVDFRGCSIAATPGAMDKIRGAVGATAALGSNCFMVNRTNGPIVLASGREVRKPSDLKNDSDRAEFKAGMKMLIESFGPSSKCILDTSEDAYFRANGQLVALWVNHMLSTEWDQRASRCYKSLVPETISAADASSKAFRAMVTGDCKLIRVEKNR